MIFFDVPQTNFSKLLYGELVKDYNIAMEKSESKVKDVLAAWYGNHIILVSESVIVGILTGLVIVAFRKSIDFISLFRIYFYGGLEDFTLIKFIGAILVTAILGLFMGFLIKKYPAIKGSGVSQIKGNFMQKIALSPCPELPLKFIGGVMSIATGLSVGREGPSVQIGAYVGSAFEKIGKQSHIEKVCLITSGAAAGLAATFGAPFAGVVFAIEDLHQYLSPLLLTCVMAGAVSGDFVAALFFKAGAIFDFSGLQIFPLKYFGWLIILGVAAALIGDLFKKSIYASQKFYTALRIPLEFRPLIPYVLSVPASICLPFIVSGGDHLIESLILKTDNFSLNFLILLLVTKLIFTGISAGSSAIGGIFVPLLSCGALTGIIFSKLLIGFNFIEPDYAMSLMIFAMAAFFATVIKAPLTAIVLLTETSGHFFYLGGVVLTVFSAYITANLIHSPANDDVILKQLLADKTQKDEDKKSKKDEGKQMFEVFISPSCLLDGKLISQIDWPANCLIVSLARGEEELIPSGQTKITAGDRLIILTDSTNINRAIDTIGKMSGNEE